MVSYLRIFLTTLFIAISLPGCTLWVDSSTNPSTPNLFLRLGGEDGIEAIVDAATVNCLADPRINRYFISTGTDHTKLTNYKNHFVDQICVLAGGPCQYKGLTMDKAHAEWRISDLEFNAFIENLVKAMAQKEVPVAEQEELVGLIGPFRKDIVRQG